MKYLKSYNENLNDSDTQFLKEIELYLNDINLELVVDYQESAFGVPVKIIFIRSQTFKQHGDKKVFSLADIKEEVEHIIFYMEDSEYELLSVRYLTHKSWSNIYDNTPNRWGGKQSKDTIFDIQDYDINKKEVINLRIEFSKNT